MATRDGGEGGIRLSVLDRLIDDEPGLGAPPEHAASGSVEEFRASVLRDLEWLLNTRRTIEEPPEDFPEVRSSLYCYGSPDISSMSGDSPTARRTLARHLQELIRTFEPRLTGVRVAMEEEGDGGAKQLRFVIEGMLRLDSGPERVSFDTVLEVTSGKFFVSGGGGHA